LNFLLKKGIKLKSILKITGRSIDSLEEIYRLSKQKHCNLVKDGIKLLGDIKNTTMQERSWSSEVVILKNTNVVSLDIKKILSWRQKKSI
jgi:hypothetical protein